MPTTGHLAVKSGKYYAVLNMYDEFGNRKQKWICTDLVQKGNKRKAEKILQQLCLDFDNKNVSYYTNMQFADYLVQWLDKIKNEVRPNTFRSYKGNMERHIIPYFKKLKVELQELKPYHLSDFYRSKVGVVANTTIKHFHQNISKALADATERGLISVNPATAAKTPKSTEKTTAVFLNHSQLQQLHKLVQEEKAVIYLPVFLASVYGLRRSEVLGLRWKNIDFEKGVIRICETLQQSIKSITGESNYVSSTKTESSNRSLPITEQVRTVLLNQKQKQQANKELLGSAYIDNDYVCTFDNGQEISPNYLTRTFHEVIVKSNLPQIRFHDLRHSVASNLLSMGFSVVQVAEWLGHSSSTTTLSFYAHSDTTSKLAIANSIKTF
ncbi:MAG: site-specific integrase [Ruminococcus sp.]|nr:site-specific integrase [Ruminococcus sp.]